MDRDAKKFFFALAAIPSVAQVSSYRAPRTADGKPDLSGIWQAVNTADWDLEGHAAAAGPVASLGAAFAKPPGLGVVEGDEIPYLPAMAAKKKENKANWTKLDPEVKCYLPGVPRATYLPYPFQIVQSQNSVLISYEYAGAVRVINMGAPTKAPADSWMGWSNGHWEGETLVVDVTSQLEDTWFDRSGNFHSDAVHVVERYTPRSFRTRSTTRPPSRIRRFFCGPGRSACRCIAVWRRTPGCWNTSARNSRRNCCMDLSAKMFSN